MRKYPLFAAALVFTSLLGYHSALAETVAASAFVAPNGGFDVLAAILAGADFVGAHIPQALGAVSALCLLLSQIAAATGLGWLSRFSPWLHNAAQVIAGNWGYAANATRLVRLYRSEGATAALAELDHLATAPASRPSVLIGLIAVLAPGAGMIGLSACATLPADDAGRVQVAANALRLAEDVAAVYAGLPVADPAVLRRLHRLDGVASDALSAARKAVASGDSATCAAALAVAEDAVRAVAVAVAEAKAGG